MGITARPEPSGNAEKSAEQHASPSVSCLGISQVQLKEWEPPTETQAGGLKAKVPGAVHRLSGAHHPTVGPLLQPPSRQQKTKVGP